MITIRLPYLTLPLRSNDRRQWPAKWRIERDVKNAGRVLGSIEARRLETPLTSPVTVTIVWEVTTHHRRDSGAAAATLKPFLDGLVAGGLLEDDRHTIVTREICTVEVGAHRGVRVEIRTVGE